MIFDFTNLGIVETAKIDVKGLTILTGLNDSGKSFISKTIYSVIKTIKTAVEEEVNQSFIAFEQFFRALYGIIPESKKDELQKLLQFRSSIIPRLLQKSDTSEILQLAEAKKNELISIVSSEINHDQKPNLDRLELAFKTFASQIKTSPDPSNKYKTFFKKRVIEQLFRNSICSISNSESTCQIKVDDISGKNQLKIRITNNEIEDFVLNNELPIFYQDATLIETPIAIQLAPLIQQEALGARVSIRPREGNMPFYYPDLISKISSPQSGTRVNQIYSQISDIIGGTVEYKEQGFKFIYKKKNGNEIEANNIATGIKSFGLLQLLLRSDSINNNSILIIDEPEVHLHPFWEIEYARIIIALTKINIPIVISTHSPYLIKALTTYSKKYEIPEENVRVYFGTKNYESGKSTFTDISNSLTPFLNSLAEPMQKLFMEA